MSVDSFPNDVFTAVLYSSTGFQQVKFKTFKDFFKTIMNATDAAEK